MPTALAAQSRHSLPLRLHEDLSPTPTALQETVTPLPPHPEPLELVVNLRLCGGEGLPINLYDIRKSTHGPTPSALGQTPPFLSALRFLFFPSPEHGTQISNNTL